MKTNWIIDKLFSDLPEFKAAIDSEVDTGLVSQSNEKREMYSHPYIIVEDFTWFLVSKVKQLSRNSETEETIQKSFQIIDDFLTSKKIISDADLLNLIYVGILEAIVWEDGIQELAEKFLSDKALEHYESYKRKFLADLPQE